GGGHHLVRRRAGAVVARERRAAEATDTQRPGGPPRVRRGRHARGGGWVARALALAGDGGGDLDVTDTVAPFGRLSLVAWGRRRGVELPAAGVQPVQRWRRELAAEFG